MTDTTPKVVVVDRPGIEAPIVVPLPWWQMVLVRTTRTYLQALVSFLGAAFLVPGVLPAATGLVLMPYGDRFLVAAQLAALPAVIAAVQNLLEVLAKLDTSAPQLRG